jgi:hypothetical protein
MEGIVAAVPQQQQQQQPIPSSFVGGVDENGVVTRGAAGSVLVGQCHPVIASIHNLSQVLQSFQSVEMSNSAVEQNSKVLQLAIYNLSMFLCAEQNKLLQNCFLSSSADIWNPTTQILNNTVGERQADQGQSEQQMRKATEVLNNRCGARDSQLVSEIFAEGSGAQVPTMEEPEVKVGQSDVTQMFQSALEAKDMELNSLWHKIDGMENQLTMLAAKEEQLKALLDKCTEDLQEEREESKGTVFLYANLLKAAEAATAQAKAEAQEMAQVVAALPLTPARPSSAEGKRGEEEGRGGADDATHATPGELQSRLAILRARPGWTEELVIDSEPEHLGKRMFHDLFADSHGSDGGDQYLKQNGQTVSMDKFSHAGTKMCSGKDMLLGLSSSTLLTPKDYLEEQALDSDSMSTDTNRAKFFAGLNEHAKYVMVGTDRGTDEEIYELE